VDLVHIHEKLVITKIEEGKQEPSLS